MSVVVKRPVGRELAATARSMGMRACPACGMWCTEAEAACTSCGRAVPPLVEATPIADQLDRELAAAAQRRLALANLERAALVRAEAQREADLYRAVRRACRRERRREWLAGPGLIIACALVGLVVVPVALVLIGRWA